jgi:hypothetical protein
MAPRFIFAALRLRHVEYFVGAFVIELWSGDRVVTRLEAKTK